MIKKVPNQDPTLFYMQVGCDDGNRRWNSQLHQMKVLRFAHCFGSLDVGEMKMAWWEGGIRVGSNTNEQ